MCAFLAMIITAHGSANVWVRATSAVFISFWWWFSARWLYALRRRLLPRQRLLISSIANDISIKLSLNGLLPADWTSAIFFQPSSDAFDIKIVSTGQPDTLFSDYNVFLTDWALLVYKTENFFQFSDLFRVLTSWNSADFIIKWCHGRKNTSKPIINCHCAST